MPLTGRHAVITGGGRGIGAAIARALANSGADVALLGRDMRRLEATAKAIAGDTQCVAVDVSDEQSVKTAFGQIRERFPRIDILVNNAGQADSAPFAKTTLDTWQRMLGVNLTGTFLCTREVLPAMMKERFGRIVNIASTAGLIGYAYVSAYVAAKHGVVGLTRSLALEAAKSGVTVNALCPGFTDTDLVREAIANIMAKTGKSEGEACAALVTTNPQGRLVQPEEIANAVLWLCAPGSEAINGQAIPIAGGEVMAG
ncbi:MAG: SDR family oxidoreductase [Betaproteobacteria bacterium]|nr:SDR family oxidoreductase [Betaproteobacteria bacterium]